MKSIGSGFILILVHLCVCSLQFTFAAEENPTYLKWSGEYRSRYELLFPPSGQGSSSLNTFSHRLILASNFKPHENIELKASLLLSEKLGQDFKGYAGYTLNSPDQETVFIYELYANWLADSGLGFQVGRLLFDSANDNFFSKNLDDAIPNRFDGGLLKYDKDFFNFSGGAFIISQFQNDQLEIDTSRLYLVSVDLKLDENLFKNINLSFISYETIENTLADLNNFVIPELSFTMYAVSLTGGYGPFFYTADFGLQQGKNVTSNQTLDASMLDAKIGYTVHIRSKSKVYLGVHIDSGDKSSTGDVDEQYNPLFYNHFVNGGRMNLLGWGNLTSYTLGLSRQMNDSTKIQIEYIKFLRSNPEGGINGLSPTGLTALTVDDSGNNTGPYDNNLNSNQKNIGDEIDILIDYKSPLGIKFQSITGLFMPGAYLKDYDKSELIYFQRFGIEFLF